MDCIEVTLPIGYESDGRWCNKVRLSHIDGYIEEKIKRFDKNRPPIDKTIALLSHCVWPSENNNVDPASFIRSLVIGDSVALLLNLRRMARGDRIQSTLNCPDKECGKKMDLDLSVDRLLIQPSDSAQSVYNMVSNSNGDKYSIEFRLPTCGNLEKAARITRENPQEVSRILMSDCIREVTRNGGDFNESFSLPDNILAAVSSRMAELDPQAEILINVECPSCGGRFTVDFDVGDYLFRELNQDSKYLYNEIHYLAFYYHWDEETILKMPRTKRQMYLQLLSDHLGGGVD